MKADKLKNLLPAFTYGFEIEGLFHASLKGKLDRIDKKLGTETEIKRDGSVNGLIAFTSPLTIAGEGMASEITSGIYQKIESLIKALALFDSSTYKFNKSCGLHLHIGAPDRATESSLLSFLFIRKLQKYAETYLCECQKTRLVSNNRYCRNYRTLKDTRQKIRNEDKYNFIRKHPQGTLEMRFFAPCQHKINNIVKVLKEVDDYVKKSHELKLTANLPASQTIIMPKIDYPSNKIAIPDTQYLFKFKPSQNLGNIPAGIPVNYGNRYIAYKYRPSASEMYMTSSTVCGLTSHRHPCEICEQNDDNIILRGTDEGRYQHCNCCDEGNR